MDEIDPALKAFLDSLPGDRVAITPPMLRWLIDHQPKGLSEDEGAAWFSARIMQLIEGIEAMHALAASDPKKNN